MWNTVQLWLRSAERVPGQDALVHRQERVDFAELQRRSQCAALHLLGYGVIPGDRVAIYADKSIDTVALMLGTWLLGCVHVPVNPSLRGPQISHIVRHSGASVLCGLRKWLHRASSEGFEPAPDLRMTFIEDIRSTGHCLAIPSVKGTEQDVAAILYTSGSSGEPKGVAVSHRNLIAGAESVASYLGNTGEDRILSVLPLSFDAGLSQLSTAAIAGATCVLHTHTDASSLVAIIRSEQITGLTAVPPLFSQLPDTHKLGGLRYFASTGGAMPPELLKRLFRVFPSARAFLMYGLTEAFRSTFLAPELARSKPGSVGKSIPNARVEVVKESGDPCEADEVGEIVHSGPTVALGYWRDPDATASRFRMSINAEGLQERMVWSGDYGYKDGEGDLYIVGRRDDIFKRQGYRVSLLEIETELTRAIGSPEVVAVGPLPQEEVVCAFFHAPEEPDEAANIERVNALLPYHLRPDLLISIATALPRLPNGKFNRGMLSEKAAVLVKTAVFVRTGHSARFLKLACLEEAEDQM